MSQTLSADADSASLSVPEKDSIKNLIPPINRILFIMSSAVPVLPVGKVVVPPEDWKIVPTPLFLWLGGRFGSPPISPSPKPIYNKSTSFFNFINDQMINYFMVLREIRSINDGIILNSCDVTS
ncbi:hypothetical protein RCL_jg12691.t1 [Rhizophagus clarus]|uniref:Uncharacterized protein n=1 Tax=Rhizophagus clarus TaxID=94130 RepID=A0A8H3LR22_9GLOM|nr:hypothetical protein RCL_jg12691.t1 [Rhizophagus clarus]